jgi:hypothetical protein
LSKEIGDDSAAMIHGSGCEIPKARIKQKIEAQSRAHRDAA